MPWLTVQPSVSSRQVIQRQNKQCKMYQALVAAKNCAELHLLCCAACDGHPGRLWLPDNVIGVQHKVKCCRRVCYSLHALEQDSVFGYGAAASTKEVRCFCQHLMNTILHVMPLKCIYSNYIMGCTQPTCMIAMRCLPAPCHLYVVEIQYTTSTNGMTRLHAGLATNACKT